MSDLMRFMGSDQQLMVERLLEDPRQAAEPGIRLHGNGFLQLDLDRYTRFHIWGGSLPPAQNVDTPIHDHTYSFRSFVLLGKLEHIVHTAVPGDRYRLHTAQPREGADTGLVPTSELVDLPPTSTTLIKAGGLYDFTAFLFHQSVNAAPITATLMVRGNSHPDRRPRIAVPSDLEPDNDFERYQFPDEELWAVVDQAVSEIREAIAREARDLEEAVRLREVAERRRQERDARRGVRRGR